MDGSAVAARANDSVEPASASVVIDVVVVDIVVAAAAAAAARFGSASLRCRIAYRNSGMMGTID